MMQEEHGVKGGILDKVEMTALAYFDVNLVMQRLQRVVP